MNKLLIKQIIYKIINLQKKKKISSDNQEAQGMNVHLIQFQQ